MIAAYIRVSTVSQNLEGQKAEIERWIAGNAAGEEVRWFVDKSTGTNIDRSGFKALQAAIFNGEVRTVIIYKLDRLSRSVRDGINVITDWTERGVRLVVTSQQIDLSGAVGRMIASVLLAVSELENETRKERQQVGIEAAKARGVYKGRKEGTTKASKARAVELHRQGLKPGEIAKALGVSRPTICRYLKEAA
jgi:DNA invertase Pin-like site-specific DNA recombinase